MIVTLSQLAHAPNGVGKRLHASPSIWLTEGAVALSAVDRIIERLPTNESTWAPCIGQVAEFATKRCTLVPVADDPTLSAAVDGIEASWNIDVAALRTGGLPIIRYLPGAPPVGVHGDVGATGLVPTATLVLYLTDAEPADDAGGIGGQTYFPALGLAVTPARGTVLSFSNVDAAGAPDPAARHGVGAVPARAARDRLVVQIPILHRVGASRGEAYAEHVSGAKHKVHMGLMGGGAIAFGIYQAYQYDRAVGHGVVGAAVLGALLAAAVYYFRHNSAAGGWPAEQAGGNCCALEEGPGGEGGTGRPKHAMDGGEHGEVAEAEELKECGS